MLFFEALQVCIWEILSDIFEAPHLKDQHHHGPTEGLGDAKLAFTHHRQKWCAIFSLSPGTTDDLPELWDDSYSAHRSVEEGWVLLAWRVTQAFHGLQ
jgi:hypothetical protein